MWKEEVLHKSEFCTGFLYLSIEFKPSITYLPALNHIDIHVHSPTTTMAKILEFWANVPSMDKCAINGQMCHLWANVPLIGKCAIYRVSGHNGQVFEGNFPSLGERCVKTEVM